VRTCAAESAAFRRWPPGGYCRRMTGYLAVMFPLQVHGALALLLYANLAWLIERQFPRNVGSARCAALAVLSILAIDLLTRLMDEIKDKDLDARYFPQRPLPAGRVSEADLRCSQVVVATVFLALAAGSLITLAWGAGLLLYAAALSRHLWLKPLLERSPLLTLATHGPFVPFLLLYLVTLLLSGRNLSLAALAPRPLLVSVGMLWSLLTGVEIARKIRAPDAESGYPTYSASWGLTPAVCGMLAAATAALLCAVTLAAGVAHSPAVALPCLAGFGWLAACCVASLREPTRWCARLRAAAQANAALVMAAFPLEGWLSP
jgi:UbiA prenyltransferase family